MRRSTQRRSLHERKQCNACQRLDLQSATYQFVGNQLSQPAPPEKEGAMQLTGLHHVTAITAHARDNHHFYTTTLGMRLVKRTVNQDDVSAWHLFYADGKASPGSDLTFFDWPAAREQRGADSVVRTTLRVAGAETLAWWKQRFEDLGVSHGHIVTRDARLTLDFEDPEGQRLALIDDGGAGEAHVWDRSPVPAQHQIRGLGPVSLAVTEVEALETVLDRVLNMSFDRAYEDGPHASAHANSHVRVWRMGDGGAAAEVHVIDASGQPRARQGAGAVHHVAFRTPDAEQYHQWAARLQGLRIPNSGEVERYYFQSLYFREPNGILFEIATDGPGFAVDEPLESLGERVALPPFLEPRRAEIEAGLKPVD